MMEHPNPEIRRLLGGYATGNLTEAEQQALFEAALQDQELFDALAEEQPLRDLLEEPGVKQALIATLERQPTGWERFRKWMASPMGWGAGAVAIAAAALTLVIAPSALQKSERATMTEQVAMRRENALPAPERAGTAAKEKLEAPAEKPKAVPMAASGGPAVARRRSPQQPAETYAVAEPAPSVAAVPPSPVPTEAADTEDKRRKDEQAKPAAPVAYRAQPPAGERQEMVQVQQSADLVQQQAAQRQVERELRDASPKAASVTATAPAAPAAAGNLAKTAEAAQAPYIFEVRSEDGSFVTSTPRPGRVRLRVTPLEDGFAVLQRNRETPLRVAVRAGVPAILPATGMDVKPGDELHLSVSGANAPGSSRQGFAAGAAAKSGQGGPVVIRIPQAAPAR